jgi:hypothetical protein
MLGKKQDVAPLQCRGTQRTDDRGQRGSATELQTNADECGWDQPAEGVRCKSQIINRKSQIQRAVRGRGRYARTRRRSSIPTTSRSLATFSGGGSWAEPLLKTAHRRIPTEAVRFRASPSCFRPHLLVSGLFSFRARVIFRSDGPTRPTQRFPVRGKVPTFPHPEPPPLVFLLGVAPSSGPNRSVPSNPDGSGESTW